MAEVPTGLSGQTLRLRGLTPRQPFCPTPQPHCLSISPLLLQHWGLRGPVLVLCSASHEAWPPRGLGCKASRQGPAPQLLPSTEVGGQQARSASSV